MTSFSAKTLHAIADELGCDPELVGATALEGKPRSKADLRAAVRARLADTPVAETPSTPADDAPTEEAPKKERKPNLTLSQRRALLRLQDEESIAPATPFKALPFEALQRFGYADFVGGAFSLTAAGHERADTINPGYRIWAAGETVAGDPNRPVAGTHRYGHDQGIVAAAELDAPSAE